MCCGLRQVIFDTFYMNNSREIYIEYTVADPNPMHMNRDFAYNENTNGLTAYIMNKHNKTGHLFNIECIPNLNVLQNRQLFESNLCPKNKKNEFNRRVHLPIIKHKQ